MTMKGVVALPRPLLQGCRRGHALHSKQMETFTEASQPLEAPSSGVPDQAGQGLLDPRTMRARSVLKMPLLQKVRQQPDRARYSPVDFLQQGHLEHAASPHGPRI